MYTLLYQSIHAKGTTKTQTSCSTKKNIINTAERRAQFASVHQPNTAIHQRQTIQRTITSPRAEHIASTARTARQNEWVEYIFVVYKHQSAECASHIQIDQFLVCRLIPQCSKIGQPFCFSCIIFNFSEKEKKIKKIHIQKFRIVSEIHVWHQSDRYSHFWNHPKKFQLSERNKVRSIDEQSVF